jgi:hypothetical protein
MTKRKKRKNKQMAHHSYDESTDEEIADEISP